MHYQVEPHSEIKLVRCMRGAIYEVVIDLGPSSPTYRKWFGVELTDGSQAMLYVPKGLAHGFQTLVDDTEDFYLLGVSCPGGRAGHPLRRSEMGIEWPAVSSRVISAKDQSWPVLSPACEGGEWLLSWFANSQE